MSSIENSQPRRRFDAPRLKIFGALADLTATNPPPSNSTNEPVKDGGGGGGEKKT